MDKETGEFLRMTGVTRMPMAWVRLDVTHENNGYGSDGYVCRVFMFDRKVFESSMWETREQAFSDAEGRLADRFARLMSGD